MTPSSEWIPVATVQAIVTQAQFDQVQSKLAKNKTFARRHNTVHPYLLRSLVSCGHCQLACIGRTLVNQPHSYYVCSGKFKAAALGRERCRSRFAPVGQLDDLVWRDPCRSSDPSSRTHPGAGTGAWRTLVATGIAGAP